MNSAAELAVAVIREAKARIERHLAEEKLGNVNETSLCTLIPAQFTGPEYMLWMCDKIIESAGEWPATKLHRWVGYVQGCMVCYGITDLEIEKEVVREAKKTFSEG